MRRTWCPAYLQGQALKYLLRMWCKGQRLGRCQEMPLVYRPLDRQTGGMMPHLPGLNLLERWALGILVRSRALALWWSSHMAALRWLWPLMPVIRLRLCDQQGAPRQEPLSMQFERIYHQPSYGEVE
jgi:hypothetical protein